MTQPRARRYWLAGGIVAYHYLVAALDGVGVFDSVVPIGAALGLGIAFTLAVLFPNGLFGRLVTSGGTEWSPRKALVTFVVFEIVLIAGAAAGAIRQWYETPALAIALVVAGVMQVIVAIVLFALVRQRLRRRSMEDA